MPDEPVVVPPASPAPIQPAQPDIQTQQLQYLKQISDNLTFIKSVIILAIILSVLGFAAEICSAMGVF